MMMQILIAHLLITAVAFKEEIFRIEFLKFILRLF